MLTTLTPLERPFQTFLKWLALKTLTVTYFFTKDISIPTTPSEI